VVEVKHPDEEHGEATTITCKCSDPRWAQAGLLGFASALVERQASS
jgi:hypothetical protein